MPWLFSVVNVWVMPFWLCMIFFPKHPLSQKVAQGHYGIIGLAVVYLSLAAPKLYQVLPMLLNPKLEPLMALFQSQDAFVVLWIHILAFDLLAGTYIYRRSLERNLHPVPVGIILFCTLMAGPLGFLLFQILNRFSKNQTQA